ncbi:MAG: adenylate/guanylate cyclase domain-containing protein, partial [Bacteroidota bacterium]
GDIDLAIQAMKDGATDFITKPWDNEKLLDTLASAYKQSKIQNALEPVDFSQDLIAEEVSRVFMFLDIKSSTEIAERLGHVKYFSLLNDFFGDISDSIVSHAGEIYQYVGDEVVISWPLEDGLSQANCLNCFFSIVDKMKLLSSSYQEKYQLNPEFKAGLHCGKVTSGMVGTVKKELVFSGEVLNTTSRIEGMCNRYQVNLLVSQSLLDQLPQGMHFTSQEIGEINLRGKQQPMTLFHVQRARRGVS